MKVLQNNCTTNIMRIRSIVLASIKSLTFTHIISYLHVFFYIFKEMHIKYSADKTTFMYLYFVHYSYTLLI